MRRTSDRPVFRRLQGVPACVGGSRPPAGRALQTGACLLALVSGCLAAGAVAAPGREAPLPLSGVPLDLACNADLPPDHPLLSAEPGEDLSDLAGGDVDLAAWLEDHLCGIAWLILQEAGAHALPEDVHPLARARLQVDLAEARLSSTRTVDQRFGSTLVPVSVPHWSLNLGWRIRFTIVREGDEAAPPESAPIEWTVGGGAEHDDYDPLRLGDLLQAAASRGLQDLPRLLADEGRLGDLLFAVVEPPRVAPQQLGLSGALARGFANLLSPSPDHRHDALAFYLASDLPDEAALEDLARWFVVNDSDVPLRRDALAWLLSREGPADSEHRVSSETASLLRWLLVRDPSPRMRSAAVAAVAVRTGPEARELLLVASADPDRQVSDVADSALTRFAPATAAELASLDREAQPPALAAWTSALDGRVPPPAGNPDLALLDLALAAGGPAAETWTARWLRSGDVGAGDLPWALPGWAALSADPSPRIRREAIGRLGREMLSSEMVEPLLAERVRAEPDPDLRLLAIRVLPASPGPASAEALLVASRADEPAVRAAAATALGSVADERGAVRLRELSDDPAPQVRRKARQAIRLLRSGAGRR